MFSNLIKQVQGKMAGTAAARSPAPSMNTGAGMVPNLVRRTSSMNFPTVSGTPTQFGQMLQALKKGPTV